DYRKKNPAIAHQIFYSLSSPPIENPQSKIKKSSSYDFVGSRQHIGRNRQSDLLCRLEIDHKFELCRLLHRQIGWLCAFQDLVHISSGRTVQVEKVHAVIHKPPVFYKPALVVYRGEPVLCRELYNLCSPRNEDAAPLRDDCVRTLLARGSKCSLNIFGILYV